MEKEWRVIEEAPNYEVSNYGDIRNIKTGRILKNTKAKDGYLKVNLRVEVEGGDKKTITRLCHRLASIAFLPNPNNYPIINHKDESRDNNYVGCAENNYEDSNLEWCTIQYNNTYGSAIQRHRESIRKTYEEHPERWSKDDSIVYVYKADTMELVGEYPTLRNAVKLLDCDYRSAYCILHKQKGRKTHKGYIFSFDKM